MLHGGSNCHHCELEEDSTRIVSYCGVNNFISRRLNFLFVKLLVLSAALASFQCFIDLGRINAWLTILISLSELTTLRCVFPNERLLADLSEYRVELQVICRLGECHSLCFL